MCEDFLDKNTYAFNSTFQKIDLFALLKICERKY